MRLRTILVSVLLLLTTTAQVCVAKEDPRDQVRTYVTFPEWYIVYSSQEYAAYVEKGASPNSFPYIEAIKQYWNAVHESLAVSPVEIDSNTKAVLRFVGASFSFEYFVIGMYEDRVGKLTAFLRGLRPTAEDNYTNAVAKEYGDFLTHTPWYDFPYFQKLKGLWSTYSWSSITPRGIERRAAFTIGYALKGVYGFVIGKLSHASLGTAELETTFTVVNLSEDELRGIPEVTNVGIIEEGQLHATAPRYRTFTHVAEHIAELGGKFTSIQGHRHIMLTLINPDKPCELHAQERFSLPVLTEEGYFRRAYDVDVRELTTVIRELDACGLTLEHVYDY